jgi:hypothetical protein
MAALIAVLRANKHRSPAAERNIEIEEDPYSFLSQFPPVQDRILDVVLGKLMLDGYDKNFTCVEHTEMIASA